MNCKLRVLFAIGSMGCGGSERQVLGILKQLDRARFTPLLYLVNRQGELLADVPADVLITAFDDRHSAPRLNYPGRIHASQVRDMAHVIQQESIDVVYDRTFLMTLIAARATKRAGVPRVSVIASDPGHDVEQTAGRFVGLKKRLLRSAYRHADCVAAVSEGVRQTAIAYHGLSPEKIITLYNHLDLEQVDRLAEAPPPKWEIERFHIVAAGRLCRQKGFEFLLAAIEQLVQARGQTQVQLHLLGTGELETELKSFVDQHQLADFVEMPGHQENPYAWFRQADLFCLSSVNEGLPNVLIEAMACRTPVLATNCRSGPTEILDGGKYGRLVPPGDTTALAAAITEAIEQPEQWQAKVAAARQFVETTFSLESSVTRVEEVLLKAATNAVKRT